MKRGIWVKINTSDDLRWKHKNKDGLMKSRIWVKFNVSDDKRWRHKNMI
jgi:hypothetical protein